MLVAIHQPHYLPWLPYVQKIAASDLFILLDDVAYTKNGWQNRNKIKGPDGWMYLSVPVRASLNQPIRAVEIAPGDWAAKHLRTLQNNYARTPYFKEHLPFFADLYGRTWERLADLCEAILRYCLDCLDIRTPLVRSSDLEVPGIATERLIHLCRAVGADRYLSGRYAASVYLEPQQFEQAGIALEFQDWHCPEYPQQFPKAGFHPDLSIVDLLFNAGPGSRDILREGGRACLPEPTPAAGESVPASR